jgi:hypothetical protein
MDIDHYYDDNKMPSHEQIVETIKTSFSNGSNRVGILDKTSVICYKYIC